MLVIFVLYQGVRIGIRKMSFAINYQTIYPDAQNIQRFYFLNFTLAGWKAIEKLDSGLQRLCTGILF